jgi:hypothetical protein
MKKIGLVLSLVGLATTAQGDVLVGIKHTINPSTLKATVAEIERAGARPAEQQEYPLYIEVQDNIILNCPAHKPDMAGDGCSIFFRPSSHVNRGDISFSIRKPVSKVLLSSKANEAAEKIEKIDPNTTEEHIQFGNPLYTLPSGIVDGTHYYCAPDGVVGKKSWKCYLSVAETLSQNIGQRSGE